ncbi:MAG: potassium transporter TrkG [Planctomycetota bacterium]
MSIIGLLVMFLALTLCIPLLVAYAYGSYDEIPAFYQSIGICFVVGLMAFGVGRFLRTGDELRIREAFGVVAIGWTIISLLGALPFWLAGDRGIPSFLDAFFESMSGFTTTGSSILLPESLPRGLLFWRSFTHWFGGMGIVVLTVAVLPLFGGGGYQLLRAEAPGPTADKFRPRIADTAKLLWYVYLALTLAEIALLLPKMDLYDAICHAFGTVATAGFSTRNASIAAFNSVYVETVILVFMLLSGVNFALHIRMLRGHGILHYRDTEFRFYLGLVAVGVLIMTALLLLGDYPARLDDPEKYSSFGGCFRAAAFQVASIVTTTGYSTADFDSWPNVCRLLLVLLMVVGACSGSTGGGTKCLRILVAFKYGLREITQLIRSHAVLPLKVGGHSMNREIVARVLGFLILWLMLFVVAVIAMTLVLDSAELPSTAVDDEFSLSAQLMRERSFETAFGAVLATLANIGPGIAEVGPTQNYAAIPPLGKAILIFLMLAGRLEIYCVLVLFLPLTWKR